jgi:hypothetical protein
MAAPEQIFGAKQQILPAEESDKEAEAVIDRTSPRLVGPKAKRGQAGVGRAALMVGIIRLLPAYVSTDEFGCCMSSRCTLPQMVGPPLSAANPTHQQS